MRTTISMMVQYGDSVLLPVYPSVPGTLYVARRDGEIESRIGVSILNSTTHTKFGLLYPFLVSVNCFTSSTAQILVLSYTLVFPYFRLTPARGSCFMDW